MTLHFLQRLVVDLREVTEVEAKPLGRDERACLFDMGPQNLSEGGVKEVGRRVIESRRPSFLIVDPRFHPGARGESSLLNLALVNDEGVSEL